MSKLRIFQTITLMLAFWQMHHASAQVLENNGASSSVSKARDSVPPLKRTDPAWQYASELQLGKDTFYQWDSAFIMVHRYNPIIRRGLPFVDLGTVASPQQFLHLNPNTKPGFWVGLNPYPLQNKTPDSFKFYNAKIPLTRFYYTQGGGGVFLLNVQHSQNIKPNWNISVDFSSMQNGEIYTQSEQTHLHRGTMLGSRYKTKNKRYENQVIFSWNRARRVENRGLINDTVFFISDTGYRRTVGNYVATTAFPQSFYANHHHVLDQKLALLPGKNTYLFHHLDWIKDKYEYRDPKKKTTAADSEFYGNNFIFIDSAFHDSTVWIQWNNQMGLGGKTEKEKHFFYWRAWYSANRIAYNSIYKTAANIYFNQGAHALFSGEFSGATTLQWTANADYYFSGRNSGDYLLQGNVQYAFSKNSLLQLTGRSQQYHAPFISERFAGNYLLYYTKRPAILANTITAFGRWHNRHLALSGKVTLGSAKNYMYTDTAALFQQVSNIAFTNFEGNVQWRFGKMHLDNFFTLQKHNQVERIPYPAFTIRSSLYFQGPVFKSAMLARFGLDLWYMSEYTGYHYQPMNGTFYPGKNAAGNYPFFDVYFSGEVKTVMWFIKLEHCNNYLTNYGFNNQYISALSYPTEPLRLRFGFVWRFYN